MSTPRPLRVLCLHGFLQSGITFRGRTAAIKNKLKRQATFVYADGPHEVTDHPFLQPTSRSPSPSDDQSNNPSTDQSNNQSAEDIGQSTSGPKLSWWKVRDDGTYDGLIESLATVRSLSQSEGPFDGLFGFSQGAAFCVLLCQLADLYRRAKEQSTDPSNNQSVDVASVLPSDIATPLKHLLSEDLSFLQSIKFVCLFSSFIPRDPHIKKMMLHNQSINQPIRVASLHVMGSNDQTITIDASEQVMKLFDSSINPTINQSINQTIVHPGGHHVPGDKAHKPLYIDFLTKMHKMINGPIDQSITQPTDQSTDQSNGPPVPPPIDVSMYPPPAEKPVEQPIVVNEAAVAPPPIDETLNNSLHVPAHPVDKPTHPTTNLPSPGLLSTSKSVSELSTLTFDPKRQPVASIHEPIDQLFWTDKVIDTSNDQSNEQSVSDSNAQPNNQSNDQSDRSNDDSSKPFKKRQSNVCSLSRPSTSSSDGVIFVALRSTDQSENSSSSSPNDQSNNQSNKQWKGGVLLLKGSTRIAAEVFAALINQSLGVPVADMRLISHSSPEYQSINQSINQFNEAIPEEERLIQSIDQSAIDRLMSSSVIALIEYFPGQPINSFDSKALQQVMNQSNNQSINPRWFTVGQLAATDILTNNTDRFPIDSLFDHSGNGANVLIAVKGSNYHSINQSENQGVLGIDHNLVTLPEDVAIHFHEKTEALLEDFYQSLRQSNNQSNNQSNLSTSSKLVQSISKFILNECGYQLTTQDEQSVCAGVLDVFNKLQSINQSNNQLFEQLRQKVVDSIVDSNDEHWIDQLKQIRPEFVAKQCELVSQCAGKHGHSFNQASKQ